MPGIAFLLDLEEGHFFPTVKLAKDLEGRGHRIHYLAPPACERRIRQQGFHFVPILGEILAGAARTSAVRVDISSLALALVRNPQLDQEIARLQPRGIILPSLYWLEALLLRCRYGLPIVLLKTNFRQARRAQIVESSLHERLAARGKSHDFGARPGDGSLDLGKPAS